MRILLTGKSGQVGGELRHILSKFGKTIATNRDELDLSDPDQIRNTVRHFRPELIVNAGAYTAVDKAESEPEIARAVNGIAPEILAEEARTAGAVLIHYSTDYVYSGETRAKPYLETDSTDPASVYGKTKLEGDLAIEESGVPHLIFRTSWIYGREGKNFLRTILQLAGEQEELRVVDDQIGTPTWCRSIAEATGTIIEQLLKRGGSSFSETVAEVSGVYHMTCGGRTSWHGFARSVLDLADPIPQPQLVSIPTKDYPTPASRPAYSVLSNAKLKATFDIVLPDWEETLRYCLRSDA
jgi:dTDP-4-dehydrorhamnose reductase